jgi:hypothetical protein
MIVMETAKYFKIENLFLIQKKKINNYKHILMNQA